MESLTNLETNCTIEAKLGQSFQISQFVGPKALNLPMECIQDFLQKFTKLISNEEGGDW